MSGQADPYIRVYYRIIDDPRFATVYDDDAALACWLRLLLIADAMYPAPAPVPGSVRPRALGKLVDAGIVELVQGGRFRVHGLAAEREHRSNRAAESARARWTHPSPASVPHPTAMRPHTERNPKPMLSEPSLTEPSLTEPRRSDARATNGEGPADDETALCLLAEQLSGTPYGLQLHSAMGQKATAMLRKHGPAAVEREWRRIAQDEGGMPTVRQLVLGADNALNRVGAPPGPTDRKAEIADFVSRMNREAEQARGGRNGA